MFRHLLKPSAAVLTFLLLELSSTLVVSDGHNNCLGPPPEVPPITCTDSIEVSLNTLKEDNTVNVILPTQTSEYDEALRQYGSVTYFNRVQPSFIAQVQTEEDVQAVVRFAKACNYETSVRSGGHSYLAVSSCNSKEKPCVQIDVGQMKKMDVVAASNQLVLGPGNRLEDLAETLSQNGLFVPTGECAKVGLGGHMQTGGVGLWSRHFGVLLQSVSAFRIVISDGTVQTIVTPTASTSPLNNDLFYAVLGGASGSWGVITELTLETVNDSDYFSAFWTVKILWNADGVVNMFRKWSELANANKDDTRWSTHWTMIGAQPSGLAPNYVELEASWVAPKAQAGDYDPQFFQSILDACTGCIIIEPLVNETEPMSYSLKERYLAAEDGPEYPAPFRHYKKNWQQTSSFPDPDETEAIIREVDNRMPEANSTYLFISQFTTVLKPRDDETRSLPWPDDVMGMSCDFFFPDTKLTPIFDDWAATVGTLVRKNFGGEDHRVFWGAFDDPNLEEDWPKYYESQDKYEELKEIKSCVDPDNLFTHLMSMPLADLSPADSFDQSASAASLLPGTWTLAYVFFLH